MAVEQRLYEPPTRQPVVQIAQLRHHGRQAFPTKHQAGYCQTKCTG
jgi:hypothetical protein